MELASLQEVGAVPAPGEDSILAVRRGRRGHGRGGASCLPASCQPRSSHGLTRLASRGARGVAALGAGDGAVGAGDGGGRGQAARSPGGPQPPGVRARPCLPSRFQRKFVAFLPLLSLGRDKDKPARTRSPEAAHGEGPARPRTVPGGAVRAGQRPGERRRGGERNSRASLCPAREGTGRVCLSGENRERQAAWPSREEQGGTPAAVLRSGATQARRKSIVFEY